MRAAEPDGVAWARRIVERYESGVRVPNASIEAAMSVLKIAPGTLVRRGLSGRRFDPRAAAANDLEE
jgi:hypothetical protein